MNRKDRLERIVLHAFHPFNISVDSFHYCYAAISDIMNEIIVSRDRIEKEAYNELKIRGLSEDKLPELIGKIYQRYSIREIEARYVLAKEAEKAYVKFLVTNLSGIETVLKDQGYKGKIVRVSFVKKPYAPILRIPSSPLYFRKYVIYPEVDNFLVTMKCKGHQSKSVNVEFMETTYEKN